ncbi:MAG: hypothetical protein OEW77_04395 [Gemmatimonadota bacterium]|nr:hypothetical protein [Gemmatimonadota bacterium]
MNRRLLRAPALVVLGLAVLAGACTERLDNGANCPSLCPGQSLNVLDTTLTPAIVFDTTLGPYPFQGYESPMLLAKRGTALDTRIIARFDTLVRDYAPSADTLRPITTIDSASLSIRLTKTGLALPATLFLDVYDVRDATANDTIPAELLPHFVPSRFLGTLQIDSADFQDSTAVRIPIDTAVLMAAIRDPLLGMRLGVSIRGTDDVALWVTTTDDPGNGPLLKYRPISATPGGADSTAIAFTITPTSTTPPRPLFAAADYLDYLLVAAAPNLRAADRFAVGGVPSVRPYLRFDLPLWLTDSSFVVRAQLEFTQDPVYGLDEQDSIVVYPQLVLAGNAVTELARAATLLAPAGFFVTDSIRRAPADSGTVAIEINGLIRNWVSTNGVRPLPSAIVLRAKAEGYSAAGLRFFGLTAAPGLRPRIRVSYVRNASFGRP